LIKQTVQSSAILFFGFALQLHGQTWSQLSPTGTLPLGRVDFAHGYNPSTDRFILFGGYPPVTTYQNDLWVLTNASGSGTPAWTELIPNGAAGSPEARADPAWAYDPGSNRLMIYGGLSFNGPGLNDLWVLTNADGTGGQPQWIQLIPTSPLPARFRTGAAYDPNTNRLIVFLGETGDQAQLANDSNVYIITNANGTGSNPPAWTQLSPTGAPPPGRWINPIDLSYNPATNSLIIFGGAAGKPNDRVTYNDTWVLTNANGLGGTPSWMKLSPSGQLPAPRMYSSGFYDSGTNRLVIFGGTTDPGIITNLSDTWALTNANGLAQSAPTWLQLSTSGNIPARRGQHSAFNQSLDEMIIFGGQLNGLGPGTNDSWDLSSANGIVGSQPAVDTVAPAVGGSLGNVTVQLTGADFQSGAQFTLTGVGGNIAGTNTSIVDTGFALATFALAGAPPGARSVVLTNPDGSSATLSNGFTVQQGGAPQLFAGIVGRQTFRVGFPQTFYIQYGNRGTVDALGVHLIVTFPSSVGSTLGFGNEIGVVSTGTSGANTVITVDLGRVPEGSLSMIPVVLTGGASQAPFTIQTSIYGH